MATMSWKSLAMLWTIAITMIFASSTEAAKVPSPQQCWGSLIQISDCASEISRAAAAIQPSMKIGENCCKAIVQLDDNCWSIMFPSNTSVSSLLKGICGSVMASPHPDGEIPGPHN